MRSEYKDDVYIQSTGHAVGLCHDCGKGTVNYRCPSCHALYLEKHGVNRKSIKNIDGDTAHISAGGMFIKSHKGSHVSS